MHLAYGKLSLKRLLHKQFIYEYNLNLNSFFLISGVRQEQDIYVRLIDSVTKQVIMNKIKNEI